MVRGLPSGQRAAAWLKLEEIFEAKVDLVLHVASLAVEPLRPALIPAAAANDLRELLGFRHFARHAYDVEPEPARMLEHGDRVARLQVALTASMAELVVRLRSVS